MAFESVIPPPNYLVTPFPARALESIQGNPQGEWGEYPIVYGMNVANGRGSRQPISSGAEAWVPATDAERAQLAQ